jgi:uncharacterized protein (TIGR00255 family)
MNSMTGFGRAETSRKDFRLSLELSSVNGRFLECIFRMPRNLAGLEAKIREIIAKKFVRGKITITVNLEESPTAAAQSLVNFNLAEGYYKQLVKLRKKLGIGGDIEIGQVIANPQLLINTNDRLHEDKIWPDLKKLVIKATNELQRMRQVEGRNLQKDIKYRLRNISRLIGKIEKQVPKNVIEYRNRLQRRIKELGEGLELDPARLSEEITIYADRSDLTEECVRLTSHLAMFSAAIKSPTDIGKKLNFILQEMGREANTISSKSLSGKTSNFAIDMKEEIEKLREQVQNIE